MIAFAINKFFDNYMTIKLIEKCYNNSINEVVGDIKRNYVNSKKDETLTYIKLDKYWKEPMAWH